MRIIFEAILLLCLLTACTSPAVNQPPIAPTHSESPPPEPVTGQWIGAATKPDGSTVSVVLSFDGSEPDLYIEPLTKKWKLELMQNGDTVQFSVEGASSYPFKQIEFTGKHSHAGFTGQVTWDGQVSEVIFTPLASVDSAQLEKLEGLYQFESGRALSIIVSPAFSAGGLDFFSKTLMMTDFESGALRGLYPIDDLTFAVGALRVVGTPFEGRIQFMVDESKNVMGLMWWDDFSDVAPTSSSGQFAARVEYHQEEVTFMSADGTQLAGLLSKPESDTPLPAFMMIHGSEPGMRRNFGNKVMAHFMLSHGFAILNYDKRGVGDSDGTYQESANSGNLQKLSEDAIDGVEYLASRPEIDTGFIGLIGFSQAGWVIPLAASQSKAITHMVILSGPAESTRQEDVFSSYTNDGDTVTEYDDAKITEQIRNIPPSGFDPIPIIAELNQPGLWLWGSVDKSVPVTFSAENLQAIIDSGKDKFSYEIFPNGDHNLNESPHGLFAEIPYSPQVLFYSTLAEWLDKELATLKE
jgi:pimeloyl-ACP methyl ester carboxylesterase